MRTGAVAVVAPVGYSVMIWAVLLGWLIFDEWPDPWAFAGIAVVTSAGLYTFSRERGRAA